MCNKHLIANAETRRDPTRTTTLRARFEADATRRFKRIRSAIIEKVARENAFGLQTNRAQFEFTRTDDKVDAFMTWLHEQEVANGLTVRPGATVRSSANSAWTATYVESAYQRGLQSAASKLRGAGASVSGRWVEAAFRRPIHADRLGIAYTRTFSELKGIADAMDQQISRVLAEGLSRGAGPLDIARGIVDRVDKVGVTRARMLARTEVINAHAEASLNAYQEAGLSGVQVEAEWLTAADACPLCVELAEKTYTLEQARGKIPAHPNCRCAFAPLVKGGSGIELV